MLPIITSIVDNCFTKPHLHINFLKVHSHQIHKLTTTRMDEGKLSINLSGHFTYNSIIITNASDLSSLRKFRDLLEKALTNDGEMMKPVLVVDGN